MRRRYLLALLAGAAAWPIAAGAQQPQRLPIIGFLGAATPSATGAWTAAFTARLRELGWTEGRNVTIEYRWADGRPDRMEAIATEFVRSKVDVIVTHSSAPVLAAKHATAVIPIVFANAGDPVGSGLVAALDRPGGNITGLSIQSIDTVGKRLELLREAVPGLRRVAVMANVANPASLLELREVQSAAAVLGLELITLEIRTADDIGPSFDALSGKTEVLYVAADPLAIVNRSRINSLALGARLVTISSVREYVEAGSLMSYGANFPELWRRTAELVDKILRGARPADIPVEQPTKFDLIINLKTALALGLEIPSALLARADEVIE